MPTSGVEERAAFADAMALIGALIGAAVGLFVLFGSRDPAMAFHGLLFVVAGVLAAIFVLKISFQSAGPSDARDDYMDGPIKVATIAAVFWGIAGFVVGDVIAWQLAFPALNLDLPLLLVLRVVMLPMRRAFLCGHLKR
jgi:cytochrome c oxidase cbb3-type subunit 1